jgi:hypothetical protein
MTVKRAFIIVLPITVLAVVAVSRLERISSVKAQTTPTSAFTVVPVGAGAVLVGHTSGTITYCAGTIIAPTYSSAGVLSVTPAGKCKVIGTLPLPISNWTQAGGSTGSVQFINSTSGEVILCAAYDVTGTNFSNSPNQPVGTPLGSCIVQTTATK